MNCWDCKYCKENKIFDQLCWNDIRNKKIGDCFIDNPSHARYCNYYEELKGDK